MCVVSTGFRAGVQLNTQILRYFCVSAYKTSKTAEKILMKFAIWELYLIFAKIYANFIKGDKSS